ncbi:MAG: YidC/Oxa1 family insertase periplasmic-domain containing protein [Sedimentisphaerales bacterium]|nr:YidC/Oxa1 family insertase periplasmic-domain containing protein [Sedimentisphaerales bacterium]
MDDDTKRMILAMLLCMGILWMWMMFNNSKNRPPAEPPAKQPASTSDRLDTDTSEESDTTPDPTLTVPGISQWRLQKHSGQQVNAVLGSLEPQGKTYPYKAEIMFDSHTAAIKEVLLSEHKDKVTDKKTGYPLLTPAREKENLPRYSFMLGALKLKIATINKTFDLNRDCWMLQPSTDDESICFSATIVTEKNEPVLEIIKSFRYGPDNYILDFSVRLKNMSAQPMTVESLELIGPLGLSPEDARGDDRSALAAFMDTEGNLNVKRSMLTAIEKKPTNARIEKPRRENLYWYAVANKYFAAAIQPLQAEENKDIEGKLYDTITTGDEKPKKTLGILCDLFSEKPLGPEDTTAFDFKIFLGPIDRDIFDNDPQYAELHYEKLTSSRTCFCSVDVITFLVLKLMKGTYRAVGNYGVAIIILVLIIRLLLHPIMKRSQINMMKMSKLQPKLEEIKQKYANNKEELQKRTMEVYREQGAVKNMILGCLPMLLQMPIWIALYSAVNTNVDVRHQGLLPAAWHWLNDLSAPDRLIPFAWFGLSEPIRIPYISDMMGGIDAINLLPILVCVAMYLQMKYSPQSKMSQSNPQMAQQQVMMKYMMPAMMFLFFYNMSSGFNLYIMASTFGGLIEQHFIRKHLKKLDDEANIGVVNATTKISSRMGPKKKKPKPPFKYM